MRRGNSFLLVPRKLVSGLLVGVASYSAAGYMYDPFKPNPTQWDVDQARRTAQNESQLVSQEMSRRSHWWRSSDWQDSVNREHEHLSRQWQAERDARMLEDRMRDIRMQEERERLRRQHEAENRVQKENQRRWARDDPWHRDNTVRRSHNILNLMQRLDIDCAPMPNQDESVGLREASERAAFTAPCAAENLMPRKGLESKADRSYPHGDEIRAKRLKNELIRQQQQRGMAGLRLQSAQEEAASKAMTRRNRSNMRRPKAGPGSRSDGKASLEERRKAAGMNADGTINHSIGR